jgi:hypothetical protein
MQKGSAQDTRPHAPNLCAIGFEKVIIILHTLKARVNSVNNEWLVTCSKT